MDFLCSYFHQINDNVVAVKNYVACTTTVSDMHFFQVLLNVERGYNSLEPLADDNINPSEKVFNVNSSETSNLDNIINEVPPHDINDAIKKQIEILCPLSFKLKLKCV